MVQRRRMADFDPDAHSCLVGNVLISMGAFAGMIALADFVPDKILSIPPHFLGTGGTAVIGLLLIVAGLRMRK